MIWMSMRIYAILFLGRFSKAETEILTDTAVRAVKAVEGIIRTDARTAMQMYNG